AERRIPRSRGRAHRRNERIDQRDIRKRNAVAGPRHCGRTAQCGRGSAFGPREAADWSGIPIRNRRLQNSKRYADRGQGCGPRYRSQPEPRGPAGRKRRSARRSDQGDKQVQARSAQQERPSNNVGLELGLSLVIGRSGNSGLLRNGSGKDMIMKKALLITLVGLMVCPCALGGYQQQRSSATAQEPKAGEQLPSIDQILNRYVQAVGGKAAIEKLNSLILTGTMEVQAAGLSGKTELIARAPNKYVLKVEIEGVGTFTQAYDGTAGWAQDPINGLRDISGVELAQLKREADLHHQTHLKELYTKLAVKGKEKVGTSDAYVIEATPPEGGTEKLYFDTQSGLLVRTDAV